MAAYTYTTLVADLRRELDRDTNDGDFTSQLATIFDRAERRIAREINLSGFSDEISGTLTANLQTLTRPRPLNAVAYFEVRTTATSWSPLRERPPSWIKTFWPIPTLTGAPRYYGLLNKTSYILAPTPDAAYPYKIGCRRHLEAVMLGVSVATNFLTEEYPDLLFAALCTEAARFSRFERAEADGILAKYENQYQNLKRTAVGAENQQENPPLEVGSTIEQA